MLVVTIDRKTKQVKQKVSYDAPGDQPIERAGEILAEWLYERSVTHGENDCSRGATA